MEKDKELWNLDMLTPKSLELTTITTSVIGVTMSFITSEKGVAFFSIIGILLTLYFTWRRHKREEKLLKYKLQKLNKLEKLDE